MHRNTNNDTDIHKHICPDRHEYFTKFIKALSSSKKKTAKNVTNGSSTAQKQGIDMSATA